MSKKDKANLLSILDAIDKILNYIKGITSAAQFYRSPLVFDATLMNFIVIGEMVDRLSPELRTRHSHIDWQKIKDFRNIVAHDYMGVDAEEVWQIIHSHLPGVQSRIKDILEKIPNEKK